MPTNVTDITLTNSPTEVLENTANGTSLGTVAGVVPVGFTGSLTYSLTVNAGGRFSLSGTTLVVNNSLLLDYEAQSQYTITVSCTDSVSGLAFTKEFPVSILDRLGETVTGSAGNDTIKGGVEADTLSGSGGDDVLESNGGNDRLDGGTGVDTMRGGNGNDTYIVDNSLDIIEEPGLNGGYERVEAAASYTLAVTVDELVLTGTAMTGVGNSAVNKITGNAVDNVIDGATGADTMAGQLGNDTYYVDSLSDVVHELADQGTDIVYTKVNYSLEAVTIPATPTPITYLRQVENLVLATGAGAIDGAGNELVNSILGNESNNKLDGKGGVDILVGGAGNDTYVLDTAGETVTELAGGGTDTVEANISYDLVANVETLKLIGTGNFTGRGNADANTLVGNTGGNLLEGLGGVDSMRGGAGNDTYVLDAATETVFEGENEGTDTLRIGFNYTLGFNVERLELQGAGNLEGAGNTLANHLLGTAGDNILDGKTGADTMVGGNGNDTYYVDNIIDLVADPLDTTYDVVSETLTGGTDEVVSTVSYTLAGYVERLTLSGGAGLNGVGNGLANLLTGNSGANILDGGTGTDTMDGGAGNDTFILDGASETVKELINGGSDTIRIGVNYTLSSDTLSGGAGFVENLVLTGATATTGTGNGLANQITGNGIGNLLNGMAGADTMTGGLGNDTYVVDSSTDVVIEDPGSGTDLVNSSASFTLGANVESLALQGTAAINGTGNTEANTLNGNSGNNLLDGKTGVDTMSGGLGNDSYVVDVAGETVTEFAGAGIDTVTTLNNVSYDISSLANIENITLSGTGYSATGNAALNKLTGNNAANMLDGGTGNDTLVGLGGNDTYVVDSVSDVVTEGASAGTDLVLSSVDYTLAINVDQLTLTGTATSATGNSSNNTLTGQASDNLLDGKVGADTMTGLAGNDTYVVDGIGDSVIEAVSAGTDRVKASISYTLAANFEELELASTAGNINATGNSAGNLLIGNGGKNVLDGSTGNDTMRGGGGDDTYIVNVATDVIDETAVGSNGTDTVRSTVTFSLNSSTNVENLELLGTISINGDGNALANKLVGNTGANVLTAWAGNDSLWGGAGNDTLNGGDGSDFYYFDTALSGSTNVDRINNFALADSFVLDKTIFTQLTVGTSLATGQLAIGSAAADATDRIIYNSVTGDVFYDADGVGGTGPTKFATITTGLALTVADFMVIA